METDITEISIQSYGRIRLHILWLYCVSYQNDCLRLYFGSFQGLVEKKNLHVLGDWRSGLYKLYKKRDFTLYFYF